MSLEVELVLGVLFGLAGWQYAIHLENKYGTSPWGLPSWAWGLITGVSLLLGAVLMAVAERALAKDPEDAPLGLEAYAAAEAAVAAPVVAPVAAPAVPVAVPGFPVVPAQVTAPVEQVLTPVAAVPAPAPVAAAGPPAGWHPDPSGKYDHRWWDGRRWTADVSTNGVAGKDV